MPFTKGKKKPEMSKQLSKDKLVENKIAPNSLQPLTYNKDKNVEPFWKRTTTAPLTTLTQSFGDF